MNQDINISIDSPYFLNTSNHFTTDPYQVTSSSTPDSVSSLASSVAATVQQVNSLVFPTSVTASMTQAANHITSQVRKMQENTLMVCTIT